MTEMVEKIARAMARAYYERGTIIGITSSEIEADLFVDKRWTEYVDSAVTILNAMREPTPDMVEAGQAVTLHDPDWRREYPGEVFEAMISAAIGAGEG